MPKLNARSLKCTLVLSAEELAAIGDPPTSRIVLHIAVPDYGPVSADVTAKGWADHLGNLGVKDMVNEPRA